MAIRLFPSSALAMGVLALTACFAGEAGDDAASGEEDALTFRVDKVDTSLPDVDAIGYEVDLTIDDSHGHESYRASVVGTYVATRDLTELSLDLDGNTIDLVKVGARTATYRRDGSKLVITLPSPVANGKTFKTRIDYHGDVRQADGANPDDFAAFGGLMVRQKNADHERIYSSLDWPSKARRWLPLRDHPSDGAMVTMTATFPKSFTVIANGKRTAKSDNAGGTTTWRYEALTPMPPYDFHVAAYESWATDSASSASGVPITTLMYESAHPHQAEVFADLPAALDYYESKFGKYRWGTASFVEEPIFGGGMEHASVVSMDETLFTDLAEAREIGFHELAHHWSGNLARIRTWNDFWLSEGFTEYEKGRFITDHDGASAGKKTWRGYLKDTIAADRDTPHPVRPPDPEVDVLTIFDSIPYSKGALCLRQIERIVSEEKLTAFLRGWFDRHAFEAVATAQLEKELSDATGKDLSKVFAGLVYGTGHPEVRVTFTPSGDGADVKVEQVQANGPEAGFVFPLDLDFVDDAGHATRVAVDVDSKTVAKHVALAGAAAPKSVVVDPDEYLLGTVACDTGDTCKSGFRCTGGTSAVRVCVPR